MRQAWGLWWTLRPLTPPFLWPLGSPHPHSREGAAGGGSPPPTEESLRTLPLLAPNYLPSLPRVDLTGQAARVCQPTRPARRGLSAPLSKPGRRSSRSRRGNVGSRHPSRRALEAVGAEGGRSLGRQRPGGQGREFLQAPTQCALALSLCCPDSRGHRGHWRLRGKSH